MHDPSADDPVERLMAELLESDSAPTRAQIDAVANAYPEHADELRARLQFLRSAREPLAPRAAPSPTRLQAIDGYTIGERIGGGGMGVVHRARDRATGREVAIKWLRADHSWLPTARARFRREIDAVASLSHPGIVAIVTADSDAEVPWFAMELVEGCSLASLLSPSGRQPGQALADFGAADLRQSRCRDHVDAGVAIALQIAEALAHAHERGVVHRDLKPTNVMIEPSGRARVIDFGLATLSTADSLTRSGTQPGSLAYMSPEQVRGEVLDGRTDIWSLGALLYETLTLTAPFLRHSEAATQQEILAAAPTDPRRLNPRIGANLAAVLGTALAPERNRRYATMAAFAADLRAIAAHEPVAARPSSLWIRLRRYSRRHPARVLGLAALTLLAALPAGLWWQQRLANRAIQAEVTRAEAAEARSRDDAAAAWQIAAFLENVFRDATPELGEGRSQTLRDALARGIATIQQEPDLAPGLRTRLLEAMARSCHNSGWFAEANALVRQVDALATSLPPLDPRATSLQRLLRARLAGATGQLDVHERALRAVLAVGADGDPLAMAEAKVELGDLLVDQVTGREGRLLLRTGIAELQRLLPAGDPRLAAARVLEARWLLQREDPAAAVAAVDAALAQLDRTTIADPLRFRVWLDAIEYHEQHERWQRAAELVTTASVAADAAAISSRHPLRGLLRWHTAKQALAQGRTANALTEAEAAAALLHEASTGSAAPVAQALACAATAAMTLGDTDRAAALIEAALRHAASLSEPTPLFMGELQQHHGQVLAARMAFEAAIAAFERALQFGARARRLPPGWSGFVRSLLARAQASARQQEAARASVIAAERELEHSPPHQLTFSLANLAWTAEKVGDSPSGLRLGAAAVAAANTLGDSVASAWAHKTLGWNQLQANEAAAAVASLEQAVAINRRVRPEAQGIWLNDVELLGNAYFRTEQYAAAIEAFTEVLDARPRVLGPTVPPNLDALQNRALAHFLTRNLELAANDVDALFAALASQASLPLPRLVLVLELALDIATRHADAAVRASRTAAAAALGDRLLPKDHPLRRRFAPR